MRVVDEGVCVGLSSWAEKRIGYWKSLNKSKCEQVCSFGKWPHG